MGGIAAFAALCLFAVYFYNKSQDAQRRARIMAHKDEWGEDVCKGIIDHKIGMNMTTAMVRESWGKPDAIDDRDIMANGTRKERWVWGKKGQSARYVYFTNDRVTRIKQ